MLVVKIIVCIVVGFIGFYTYVQAQILQELLEKATNEEKKAMERIETVAFCLLLFVGIFTSVL